MNNSKVSKRNLKTLHTSIISSTRDFCIELSKMFCIYPYLFEEKA